MGLLAICDVSYGFFLDRGLGFGFRVLRDLIRLRPDIWCLGVLVIVLGEQGQVELSAFYLMAAISSNKYVIYWLFAGTLRCIQSVRHIWKDFRVVPAKNRLEIMAPKSEIKVATNEN